MRHQKSGRKLNRNSSHRQAMFRNMAASLFRHEQIRTTLPKAKELRRVAEPLITLAKTASVANRRLAFARLRDRMVVGKLFNDLGIRFKDRPGGYLRILKSGFRPGDKAPMAVVQLVEMAEAAAIDEVKTRPEKKPAASKSASKAKPAEAKTESKASDTGKTAKKAAGKKTTKKKTTSKKTTSKKAAKKKVVSKKAAGKKATKKKAANKKTAKKKTTQKK